MQVRTKAIIAGVLFSSGLGIGLVQSRVEYKIVTLPEPPPKILTHVETKEVVKTEPLPESCKSLVSVTIQSFEHDKTISEAAGRIRQAVDEGVTHLAMNEPTLWAKAEQRVIDAQTDLSRAQTSKGELIETIKRLQADCAAKKP